MNLTHFKTFSKSDILSQTRLRRFETKLGELVDILPDAKTFSDKVANLSARYVVIGIPEDIGIRANWGQAGAYSAWNSFLQAFLNIQSNDFLEGDDVALIGYFDFSDIGSLIEHNADNPEEKVQAYRHAVNVIDEEVESLVKLVTSQNKIPIVIGGGHNNAYPLLKGAAKGLHASGTIPIAQINCINLDAHTDYRPAEGRHSGNAFRYAEDDGFLQKYCVIGLHESYLPQNVWMDLVNNPFMDCITYEDIFIHEKRTFHQAVAHAISFTDDGPSGVELDLDSVEGVLSSASTPSGVSVIQARQYVNLCAANANACYLHICEGATRMTDGRSDESTGKLIAYLVADFIKMHEIS